MDLIWFKIFLGVKKRKTEKMKVRYRERDRERSLRMLIKVVVFILFDIVFFFFKFHVLFFCDCWSFAVVVVFLLLVLVTKKKHCIILKDLWFVCVTFRYHLGNSVAAVGHSCMETSLPIGIVIYSAHISICKNQSIYVKIPISLPFE